MKKFQIKIESMNFSISDYNYNKLYSSKDLEDNYQCKQREYSPELVKEFDNEDEARKYFEVNKKSLCSTTLFSNHGIRYVKYDVLTLEASEDDGKIETLDTFIKPTHFCEIKRYYKGEYIDTVYDYFESYDQAKEYIEEHMDELKPDEKYSYRIVDLNGDEVGENF